MEFTIRGTIVVLLVFLAGNPTAHSAGESAPAKDRVGFPQQYSQEYTVLRAVYRTEKKQVVTVYGNREAASISKPSQLPYPYGSVIVMETANTVIDADGNAVLDNQGKLQKREVVGLHVMRRGPGFGVEYGKNRTGDWEYAEYRSDGSYITPPAKSYACAQCHQKAGPAKDWVYHGRFAAAPDQ